MRNINKIMVIALAMCLLLSILVLSSCGDETDTSQSQACTEHIDDDNNAKCDKCGADVEKKPCIEHIDDDYDDLCDECGESMLPPVVTVNYTVTVKKDDGTAVGGVKIVLMSDGKVVTEAATNESGVANGTVAQGEYLLIIEDLPENWYSSDNYKSVNLVNENNSYEIEVIDNTPNGTYEKPFPVENATTGETASVTFPAGATYNFSTKGAGRYMIINNANAKVTYKDEEYTANEDGVVRVLLQATESTEFTIFQITNTASEENLIKVTFEFVPGTADNPYVAELDTEIVAQPQAEGIVYYTLTANKGGILVMKSNNPANNIMLYNTTSYAVTNYSNGSVCEYIAVSQGDEIDIMVGIVGNKEPCDIEFTLSIYEGGEDEPIPVYEEFVLRFKAQETLYLEYLGENASMMISYSGITVYVNGTEQPNENGDYLFIINANDTVKIVNGNDERAELEILILQATPYEE